METFTKKIRSADKTNKVKKNAKAPNPKTASRTKKEGAKAELTLDPLERFPDENPNPVMRVGEGGLLLYANRASAPLLRQWGCRSGGRLPRDWMAMVDKALSDRRQHTSEEPCGKRVYSIDIIPITETDYANLYGRDITVSRRAEKILKENEDRFKILFELAPDAYYISDLKGNFVDGNKAAEELLGYDRNELIGSSFLKLNILGPDQIMKAAALLARNLMRKSTGPDEFDLIRKDGSQVRAEIKTLPIQIRNKTLVLGIARDITERKLAEAKLRVNEERLSGILFSMADWVWEVDENGVYTYSSERGSDLFGASRENIIGKTPFDFMPPDEAKRVASIFLEIVANKSIIKDLENWNIGKNGERICLLTNGLPILDEKGNFKGYRGVDQDITDRKRAEEAVRRSETKFRTLYESTSDAVMLLDRNGFFDCNQATLSIFGCSTREEFCTKHPADVSPPTQPDGTDSQILADRKIMTAMETGSLHFEWMHRRVDTGETFPAEVLLSGMEMDGKPILQAVVRDITGRKRAEEELRESNALIEAVVENVPLMIFLKEATDLRFVIFNRAGEELLGYDRKTLLGKNNLDLFPPEQAAHFMAKDREVLNGEAGMLDIPEEPIQTAKKGQRLLHTRKVCIRGPDGTTKYLLGISEDITERKAREERLKSLLKEKELLVREVHHRVKNNFAVVSSLLGLQAQQIEDETVQNMFMESRDRIRSMSLIHERLYQSKDFTHIDLSEYIRALAADLHQTYGADQPNVTLTVEADEVSIEVDQAIPCGLILNELISNALKYGFPPGWKGERLIAVILRKISEDQIELTVKDNGVGLPDDFDIAKTRSLGLKIVHMLVEDQLKGELKIDRPEGTGFIVRFHMDK